ncbi:hypothetical protein ACFFQW_31480 [Umezawaea endophytica]|uniref:Uncharacterized protein n=1 Tax=Umezawaea endophytica TaxID=1654476 RepID=A0A9X2VEQ8_9PSEU|nr:hypothetical protein [Umezawaea endophytica]MCS7475330.1 hypothetical protein [Umezawaea endophytica]
MRCGRVDVVLSFALGTLLVCGVVDVVVAVLWGAWWLWTVGGLCLAAAAVVAAKWHGHATRCDAPPSAAEPPERLRSVADVLKAVA